MKFNYYMMELNTSVLITPLVALSACGCDDCEELAGYTLEIGWLFWTFTLEVITA